jgi:hypothetical protein
MTNQQANIQRSKQSNKQANKQTSKQANKQSSKQASNHPSTEQQQKSRIAAKKQQSKPTRRNPPKPSGTERTQSIKHTNKQTSYADLPGQECGGSETSVPVQPFIQWTFVIYMN